MQNPQEANESYEQSAAEGIVSILAQVGIAATRESQVDPECVIATSQALNRIISSCEMHTNFEAYKSLTAEDFGDVHTLEEILDRLTQRSSLMYSILTILSTCILCSRAYRDGSMFIGVLESNNSSLFTIAIWENGEPCMIKIMEPSETRYEPNLLDQVGEKRLERFLLGIMWRDEMATYTNERHRRLKSMYTGLLGKPMANGKPEYQLTWICHLTYLLLIMCSMYMHQNPFHSD